MNKVVCLRCGTQLINLWLLNVRKKDETRFDSSLFPFYKAAGSPHSGYTYIYRSLLYCSHTEGRGSMLHRLQKTTLIEPHLQVSDISRESGRKRVEGETAQEKRKVKEEGRWCSLRA